MVCGEYIKHLSCRILCQPAQVVPALYKIADRVRPVKLDGARDAPEPEHAMTMLAGCVQAERSYLRVARIGGNTHSGDTGVRCVAFHSKLMLDLSRLEMVSSLHRDAKGTGMPQTLGRQMKTLVFQMGVTLHVCWARNFTCVGCVSPAISPGCGVAQCFIYERGGQLLSRTCLAMAGGILAVCGALWAAARSPALHHFQDLDLIYVVGYIKVGFPCRALPPPQHHA